MIKGKLDDTVDESSADQEIHNSNVIVHNLREIWRPAPSETGSYSRQAVRQTKFVRGLKF